MLLGSLGGRFADVASQPGKAWAEDVISAIHRKERKAIFSGKHAPADIVIYPNSNASILLSTDEDELMAIQQFQKAIDSYGVRLSKITNGCCVNILGAYCVFLDVLGRMQIIKR